MADIVVIGGGLAGQEAAMLLAADGHSTTVLERDPAPPPGSPDDAWECWERRGVNQFRMLHFFLARFRAVVERELPELVAELDADGGLRINPLAGAPTELTGGLRDGDDRFEVITGRRPMVERTVARVATRTPGVDVRRGVAVRGLLADDTRPGAPPHVVGVVTDDGGELRADLVVDAAGRRSPLPRWLGEIGARPVVEELEDCGFVYYAQHFRSLDGSVPPAFGPYLQAYDSISILTLPADNGTWGVGLITSAHDRALLAARDPERWERVVRSYPLVAHWLDGEPISDVDVMAKIEDRHRCFVIDGTPVATGVVALADSWACTNPSVGRGASIGLLHACGLRDLLRTCPLDDPVAFATAWHDETQATVEPLYRDTLWFDRHRLAEIDAQIAGRPYETDDPGWRLGQALAVAAGKDPDSFRAYLDIVSLTERAVNVFERPGVTKRALQLGADPTDGRAPGPSRDELLSILGAEQ
jgi:2-polyprenyl-6-methoxyphenol hydroxylase-like FAD-dependent oxidoreductase